MYELNNKVERFYRCSRCGSDNSVFDIIETKTPKEVFKSRYTIQCTYCGRERTSPFMNELITEWNRYDYEGDEYPDTSKKAEGNEILRKSNGRLREENKALMARIKELEDENMRLFKKLTTMPEESKRSGLENLGCDELMELSDRIKDAEEGHRTMESVRWSKEHDSREALRLSEQLYKTGCLNLEDRKKFDYYVSTGVLSGTRECLKNAAQRAGAKRVAAHEFVERSRFIYDI